MKPAWRASSRASRVKISATTGLLFCRRRPSSLYSRKPENSAGGGERGGALGEQETADGEGGRCGGQGSAATGQLHRTHLPTNARCAHNPQTKPSQARQPTCCAGALQELDEDAAHGALDLVGRLLEAFAAHKVLLVVVPAAQQVGRGSARVADAQGEWQRLSGTG